MLVAVFREVRRVLKRSGTIWVNMGDSYYSSNGMHTGRNDAGQRTFSGGVINGGENIKFKAKSDNLKPKDLIGIPWMLAFALRSDGWYLRRDIIWNKTNAMPEPVTDRPVKSHEYIFLLSKSQDYWYDADAVREPYSEPMKRWGGAELTANGQSEWDSGTGQELYRDQNMRPNPNGRNCRDVWNIPTVPFPGAHFAAYPPELVKRCVLAGCPEGGIVLDPFAGSGTTVATAIGLGRDGIGLDLSYKYLSELAQDRLKKVQIKLL